MSDVELNGCHRFCRSQARQEQIKKMDLARVYFEHVYAMRSCTLSAKGVENT